MCPYYHTTNLLSVIPSIALRGRIPGILVHPLLRALQNRAVLHPGGRVGLQQGLVVCWRILALRSALDPATLAWVEQLRARGSRHLMLRPVAPALPQQRLLRVVPLHLLPAAASPAHGLLIWPNLDHRQEGEFVFHSVLIFTTCMPKIQ